MYDEIKYINGLGSQLRNFKQKSSLLWNFSCPLCGDSKKNKLKARGYLFRIGNYISFKCHNCSVALSFSKFLEQIDPSAHRQYKLDKFQRKAHSTPKQKSSQVSFNDFETKYKSAIIEKSKINLDDMVSINTLYTTKQAELSDTQKLALEYIVNRKLPKNVYDRIFYCDGFKSWVNSIIPDKFKLKDNRDLSKIVIPFYDSDGTIMGCQARAFVPEDNFDCKYLTVRFVESKELIYGLDKVEWNKTVYIVEGPFDSMFFDNALAVASSSLHKKTQIDYTNTVLVYDNQPRSEQLVNEMKKAINDGRTVYFWDAGEEAKDVNEFILNGNTMDDLCLEENAKTDLIAKLQLQNWKKI